MCHCAENRALLLAAMRGRSPVSETLSIVGANMADDARALAARAASMAAQRMMAARARLRR